MGRRCLRAVATLLQVASFAPRLHAEANAVSVATPCPIDGTTSADIIAILRAQLAPLIVEPSSAGENSTSTVQVTVDGCHSAGADLQVIIEQRGERQLLRIDLVDVAPIARNRTLALALAESIQHALTPPSSDENSSPEGADATPEAALPPSKSTLTSASNGVEPPPPPVEKSSPARAQPARLAAHPIRKVMGFALTAEPLARYAFKTSTAYAGLDAGGGLGRFGVRLRALGSKHSVQDGAVWQGALLGVLSVDWPKMAPNVSLRSEVEVGAARVATRSGQSAIGHAATSPHWGGATFLRLESPLSEQWALESDVGVGFASSLTSQTYHVDSMSLSGVFLQASFGVRWGGHAP